MWFIRVCGVSAHLTVSLSVSHQTAEMDWMRAAPPVPAGPGKRDQARAVLAPPPLPPDTENEN